MCPDPVILATYVVTLAAPVAAYASVRLVRRGDQTRHRRIQTAMLVLAWSSVLALEARIRLGGGSGGLVAGAPAAWRSWAQVLLLVHIGIAVVTYVAWTWLVVVSRRRHGAALPGSFSRVHRRLGRVLVGGLILTAASATGMFALSFAC